MNKMGEHVQASPSLLNVKVLLCATLPRSSRIALIFPRRILARLKSVPWLSGRTVVRHVVLYCMQAAHSLFRCVLHLARASGRSNGVHSSSPLPKIKSSFACQLCQGNPWKTTQPSSTGDCAVHDKVLCAAIDMGLRMLPMQTSSNMMLAPLHTGMRRPCRKCFRWFVRSPDNSLSHPV